MKTLNLKQQLLIATLLPVGLIALLFAFFYNVQLNKTLKEQIAHLGETYINQLIPAAQLTMIGGDAKSLQGLVDSVATNADVKAVAFYNEKGHLMAYRGGSHPKHKMLENTRHPSGDIIKRHAIGDYGMRFFAPVTLQQYNLYAKTQLASLTPSIIKNQKADSILGWVSIDLDTKAWILKKYSLYLASICISLIGIGLGLLAHFLLSRRVIREVEVSVESATDDLHQSLELLEEKNVQLLINKKSAEEALKQKSNLMTSLSHEIKTPMNGIIGFANVLLETSLTPVARDHVKTIKASAKDLLSILNNILDYSKINAGKLKLDTIPLDIRNCIDDVLAIAAPNAHKKGLDLIASTTLDVPKTVVGDPLRLKQIINNLISNAIKFTHQGHILIRTRVASITDNSYTLCLAISDTGIGISKADQKTLFHAFHQAQHSAERNYGGSGLGLAICKQLAKQMQGHIDLDSHPNQGSTFSVYLTFSKLPAYEVEKVSPKRFSAIKAICFDHQELYLEALCHGAGHIGVECIPCRSLETLEHHLALHQDANIIFAHISTSNEKVLLPILKAQPIPFVLLSKWVIEDYQAMGAQGFLLQPPNIQKLQNIIETLLMHSAAIKHNHIEIESLRAQLKALKAHLLIAEDNTVNQMLLNAWLNPLATIDQVDDGEQALAICHQRSFDAILIDLHMPKLNGLEATKWIRQQQSLNQQTPVILISADNQDLDRAELDKHKINRKLHKPIDEKTLLHHLITVLKDAKSPAIDFDACIEKMSGNQALAEDFLCKFVNELPKHIQTFEMGLAQQNNQSIEDTAHMIRGACGFCSVPRLEQSLAKLEYLAKRGKNHPMIRQATEEVFLHIQEVLSEYHNQSIHSQIIEHQTTTSA